jgi:hypothetical protein
MTPRRITGHPEVMPTNNFQRRGPEVGFWEVMNMLARRLLPSDGLPGGYLHGPEVSP